jgi:SulP family sulfate permease
MTASLETRSALVSGLQQAGFYLQRPYRLFRTYDRTNLRPDLVAGLTVAVIALPQAIAFAIIAQLPPQMGLYATIVGALVGALWGISNQAHYGPANAISLLVAASLTSIYTPGTANFMLAAGVMAVMVGVFQLLLGIFRLGVLVNFVSHSVIVGFTAGAGLLILIKQLGSFLGVSLDTANPFIAVQSLVANLADIHPETAVLGVSTIVIIFLLGKFFPKLPGSLISIVIASGAVFVFRLDEAGVAMIGELPRTLPPFIPLPMFDWALLGQLASGAVAVGAIALVQTSAIVRSMAAQTGQRIDNNQEFVGQGMVNIAAGFFSGYAAAASFSRSAVNYKAGAKTPMAAIFSSIILLIITLVLAPLAAYLPMTALSAVIIIIAYGLIDRVELSRIWHGAKGDAAIMIVTLLGTLFLDIEMAVLFGILFSLVLYIVRSSMPRVHAIVPNEGFRHLTHQPERPSCPQLSVVEILGDLYFGAVNHVEETLLAQLDANPEQRFLLIRMNSVNQIDFSGIHMLENVVQAFRDHGGDVCMIRVPTAVKEMMESTGFDVLLGKEHFLHEDEAIGQIFNHVLDPVICIYECPLKVFKECQNLPKRIELTGIPHDNDIPAGSVIGWTPQDVWQQLHAEKPEQIPVIVDVREPREYRRGHIPDARSVPLSTILLETVKFPNDRPIVIVCRSSRRSRRAAFTLQQMGVMNVSILDGGMLAWEAASLLQAVDYFGAD